MERIIKYIDEDGNLQEKNMADIQRPKILSTNIEECILDRIKKVYDIIKDPLESCSKPVINSLESFEILFMRTKDPNGLIDVYEKIAKCYSICIEKYEEKDYIFLVLVLNYLNALTEEEKKMKYVQDILDTYNSM